MILNEIELPSRAPAPALTNENYKVDVNRGVWIRFTRGGEFPEGMAVYMYLDRPGVFFNDHNKPIPPAVAEAAGYDIKTLGFARRKQEAMLKAQGEVEAAYRSSDLREVVREEGEYRLVHIGSDRYLVEFEDGSALTPFAVSKEIAERTFRAMLGEDLDAEPVKPAKK